MTKIKYCLIFLLSIFLILFVSSCGEEAKPQEDKKDDTEKNDDKKDRMDEFGYVRDKFGLYFENIILNSANYNKYSSKIIGDGGKSGLINKDLVELDNKDINENETNYFVCVFYGYWNGAVNLKAYFKASLINENEIVYDKDAITTEDIIHNDYEISGVQSYGSNVTFDLSKDSFNCLSIKPLYLGLNLNSCFSSFVIPFKVKEKGRLSIDFSVNEDRLNFSYLKNNKMVVGSNSLAVSNVSINDYKVSFISEMLFNNGNFSEDKLTNDPKFITNYAKYMVVDLDLTTLVDNDGNDKINIFVHSSNPSALEASIEDVPTSDIKEEIVNNEKHLRASVNIPREADTNKKYRLIFKFVPKTLDENDIFVYLTGSSIPLSEYQNASYPVRTTTSGLVFSGNSGQVVRPIDENVTEVYIPAKRNDENVTVRDEAFKGCKELMSVVIEDGVRTINDYAFADCSSLTYISIPESVTSISANAFDGCPKELFVEYNDCLYVGNDLNKYFVLLKPKSTEITKLNVNVNAKIIAKEAFANTKLNSVNITGINYIGQSAFENCKSLKEITIPSSVTSIGYRAFNYCNYLEKITLNKELLSISNDAFLDCYPNYVYYNGTLEDWCNLDFATLDSNPMCYKSEFYILNNREYSLLTELSIPDNITVVKKYTFGYFSQLTSINIPNTVTEIEAAAFYECNKITSIIIPNSVTKIGRNALAGWSNLEELSVPFIGENRLLSDQAFSAYPLGYLFGDSKFTDSTKATQYYWASNDKKVEYINYIPNKLKTVNVTDSIILPHYSFLNCGTIENINLPNSITIIGNYAFGNCTSLVSISLPENLEIIAIAAFAGCSSLNNVVIPEKVTSLYESLFSGCSSLDNIVLNDNLIEISDNVFEECEALVSITLPSKLEKIGEKAFSHCEKLESIIIPDTVTKIAKSAFRGCTSLKSISLPNLNKIEDSLFANCSSLAEIIIPSSVTEIGRYAFEGCKSLKTITIPENVISIGGSSFVECEALENVIFLGNINSFGVSAFARCINLEEIAISNSIKEIKNYAFSGCVKLTNVIIPDGIENIGESIFEDCISLTNLTIPFVGKSAEESTPLGYFFGTNSYENCAQVTQNNVRYYIPNSLKNVEVTNTKIIDEYAFANCSNLEKISIPSTVETIASNAFYNCSSSIYTLVDRIYYLGNDDNPYVALIKFSDTSQSCIVNDNCNVIMSGVFNGANFSKIKLPNGLKKIEDEAFINCYYLKEIEIPESVTTIGARAFYACNQLEELTLPSNLTTIKQHAFISCWSLKEIVIPNSVVNLEEGVLTSCNKLEKVTIPYVGEKRTEQTKTFSYLFTWGNKIDIPTTLKEVIVCSGEIPANAFYKMTSLEKITLQEGITSIGDNAFNGTSLTEIDIPSTVEKIGRFGLSVTTLKNITIPTNVKEIGYYALPPEVNIYITNLTVFINAQESAITSSYNLYLNGELVTNLIIPSGITKFVQGLFLGNNHIVSIVIPKSVILIDRNSFEKCSKLEKIYYMGTEEEWNLITKDASWLSAVEVVFNYQI